MEEFLRRNRTLLISLAFLLAGLYVFGYAYFYHPYETAARALRLETPAIKREARELREARQANEAELTQAVAATQRSEEEPERIRSISDFLEHINATARSVNAGTELPKVVLLELTPESGTQLNYNIELQADYLTFLKFTAQLELRDMVINDLEVRELDASLNPPVHLVRFRITPRNDLRLLPPGNLRQRAEAMATLSASPDLRNPFQRLVPLPAGTLPTYDLSNKYRLTGIGPIQGRMAATIDRRDYFVDDVLAESADAERGGKGKVITTIDAKDEKVYLEEKTEQGTARYVIGYPD